MLIDIRCPKCGTTFKTSDDFAGKTVRCENQQCDGRVQVEATVPKRSWMETEPASQKNEKPLIDSHIGVSSIDSMGVTQPPKAHEATTNTVHIMGRIYVAWNADLDSEPISSGKVPLQRHRSLANENENRSEQFNKSMKIKDLNTHYHYWEISEDIKRNELWPSIRWICGNFEPKNQMWSFPEDCFHSTDSYVPYGGDSIPSSSEFSSQFVIPEFGRRLEDVADAILSDFMMMLDSNWSFGLATQRIYPNMPGTRRSLRFFTKPREGAIEGYDIHFENRLNFLRIGFKKQSIKHIHYRFYNSSMANKARRWLPSMLRRKYFIDPKIVKELQSIESMIEAHRGPVSDFIDMGFKLLRTRDDYIEFLNTHYPGYVDLTLPKIGRH